MKLVSITTLSTLALVFSLQALSNHNSPESLEARVSAVGTLNVGGESNASESEDSGPVDGESVYNTTCAACHTTGVAGAPETGDIEDWSDRIEQSMEVLVEHAIQGYTGSAGVMPAKGGNPNLSDEAVTAAVQYMVDQSQ